MCRFHPRAPEVIIDMHAATHFNLKIFKLVKPIIQFLFHMQNSVWEGWQINLALHACDFLIAVRLPQLHTGTCRPSRGSGWKKVQDTKFLPWLCSRTGISMLKMYTQVRLTSTFSKSSDSAGSLESLQSTLRPGCPLPPHPGHPGCWSLPATWQKMCQKLAEPWECCKIRNNFGFVSRIALPASLVRGSAGRAEPAFGFPGWMGSWHP